MRLEKKLKLRRERHLRLRKKVHGTNERPRMAVRFTGKNIYVQFIDDEKGMTLASATSLSKGNDGKNAANTAGAQRVGKAAAEAAKGKGIEKVVFDRSGAKYHGKVKALADAAREAGLQF
ncbi:MAG: 50S ribosomal protein L18 [Verrucomicrobiota bacterium]|nr:50S ribosomal protein L18 [Verrucomicrobiota bacterium]